jgi:hypothetical protein
LADDTLVFVQIMFIAPFPVFVLKVRMTEETSVFVPVMLFTPQSSLFTQGRITDKTHICGSPVCLTYALLLYPGSVVGKSRAAQHTLVFVQMMFVAPLPVLVFKIRVAEKTSVFIPVMFFAPQSSLFTQGGITDKTHICGCTMGLADLC